MNQQIKLYREGKGEPLVLLHGWGMNARIFDPLIPALIENFEVIRVDLPGHGQSPWYARGFEQQVDQIAELLPGGHLLGWSMGGLFATRLAYAHPQRFKKLVLVSSSPCFVRRESWPCAMERSVFDEFSNDLIADWHATIQRFIGLQLHGIEQSRSLIRRATSLLVEGGRPQVEALQVGLQLLLQHDAREELVCLNQPVLAILGARDKLVPRCLADYLAQINARIRVECLPRSAHMPFVSHPQSVAEIIREFIR